MFEIEIRKASKTEAASLIMMANVEKEWTGGEVEVWSRSEVLPRRFLSRLMRKHVVSLRNGPTAAQHQGRVIER